MTGGLRFDCVFYYVRDLDRGVRFYSEVLGLELTSRDAVARFHLDGVLIELVPTDDPSLCGGDGNARLTLDTDDLEATSRRLQELGLAVSPVRQVENGHLATFRDPDGNELVLWQYI